MGWDDSGRDKDPWGGKKQPPDLDEALKKLQEKLRQALFGRKDKSTSPGGNDNLPGRFIFGIAGIAFILLWALSGIFIVDPAEQAVIVRFGRYIETVGPGPHWIPRLIESKTVYNVDRVSDYSYSAQMLTKDENLVSVSLVVQYRIGDIEAYVFNVNDPEESLKQATSSALRQVVGMNTLDQIITEGREAWGISVQEQLTKILAQYQTGIVIVNVSPQPARAPESVQDAFDDAIKAQEDEKRFKEQARAYSASVVPIAEGQAKRVFQEADAYKKQIVLKARGDIAMFEALLPQYEASPGVISSRLYLETMQEVLSHVSKIVVDNKTGNMIYLPLDKLNLADTKLKVTADLNNEMASTNGDSVSSANQDARSVFRQGRVE